MWNLKLHLFMRIAAFYYSTISNQMEYEKFKFNNHLIKKKHMKTKSLINYIKENRISASVGILTFLPFIMSAQLQVISNGNVGIGTTTPGALLDVNGGFFRTTFNTASLPASNGAGG